MRRPRLGVSRAIVSGLLVSVVAGLLISIGTTASVAAQAPSRPATDPGACTTMPIETSGSTDPFKGVCDYLDTREGVVQVALYDKANGNTYLLSNGSDTQYTASIVKVDILALWLHTYQLFGTKIPDALPYSIQFIMGQMIDFSDNAAATALFYFSGGCKSLTALNTLVPLTNTMVACETPTYYGWGNTTTTAADQVNLMKLYAYGGNDSLIGTDARNYGLKLMESVDPSQRWGLTCGPWGTDCAARCPTPGDTNCPNPTYPNESPPPGNTVTVALKNGWKTLPDCKLPIAQCPWQVNSTGWVMGQDRDYVLTILTTKDPVGSGDTYGFKYGIDTVQNVSKMIWANLG
jgi:hypothetical protein